MNADIRDAIARRGETIAELCLTEFESLERSLFRPAFLGDKWPTIDMYVEVEGLDGLRPYFFVQVKATAADLRPSAKVLPVGTDEKGVRELRAVPGPTYIFGVHVPSGRVFAKAVHAGTPNVRVSAISLRNELTPANLRLLYNELGEYWKSRGHKPHSSVFQ